jgi:hypothetical protein
MGCSLLLPQNILPKWGEFKHYGRMAALRGADSRRSSSRRSRRRSGLLRVRPILIPPPPKLGRYRCSINGRNDDNRS